jgi:hypothetical protein
MCFQTLVDHQKYGQQLKETRNELMEVLVKNRKTSPQSARAKRELDKLEAVRCEMDDLVCAQFPQDPAALRCYYGEPENF